MADVPAFRMPVLQAGESPQSYHSRWTAAVEHYVNEVVRPLRAKKPQATAQATIDRLYPAAWSEANG